MLGVQKISMFSKNSHMWQLWVSGAGLVLVGLACSLPGRPTPPASPIPVSSEAAQAAEQQVATAVANAINGQLTLELTEAQLTSYVHYRLAEQPDSSLKDVQIYLRDGKLQLFGNAVVNQTTTVPASIILSVSINAEGRAVAKVESADFGPIPVPTDQLTKISDNLNQLLAEQFQSGGATLKLTTITIADGKMTVQGTLSP